MAQCHATPDGIRDVAESLVANESMVSSLEAEQGSVNRDLSLDGIVYSDEFFFDGFVSSYGMVQHSLEAQDHVNTGWFDRVAYQIRHVHELPPVYSFHAIGDMSFMRAVVPILQSHPTLGWAVRHFYTPDVQADYSQVTRSIGLAREFPSTLAGLRESRLTPREGVVYRRPRSAPARRSPTTRHYPQDWEVHPTPSVLFRHWRMGNGPSSRILIAEQRRYEAVSVGLSHYDGVPFYHQNRYGSAWV
jgi:hypothetical protein